MLPLLIRAAARPQPGINTRLARSLSCALAFSLLLGASLSLQARDYRSHEHLRSSQGQQLRIQADDGALTLRFVSNQAIEVVFEAAGETAPASQSLIPTSTPIAPTRVIETEQHLVFGNGLLEADIRKAPLQISYRYKGKLLVRETDGLFRSRDPQTQGETRGASFRLDAQEKLLGGGERVMGMDRRGQRLPLYNQPHGEYSTHSQQMNYSLPGVLSSNQYLLMFDNAAKGWLDLGRTRADELRFEAVGGRHAYYLVAGDGFADITQAYVQITGTQPMPPRWAFGYLASRFGYHTQAEAEATVRRFKQEQFPLDGIIFDLYWFGKNIQGHMGNLDWDRQAFPQPEKMMASFKRQGIETVLITEPFVLTTSSKWQDALKHNAMAKTATGQPATFDFYFGNTGLVDVFHPAGRDWFWQQYRRLMQQGASGWWGDLGEPELHPSFVQHATGSADEVHNAYGHEWASLIHAGMAKDFPERRLFLLMRSGFAGSQRYGLIPWTGDVNRGWGGLQAQVELSLSMGIMGLAYTHSDLGGFASQEWDAEAYTRWLQYGVFQPIYRPHGIEPLAPEPVFHSAEIKNRLRPFVQLRYRLMPYLYTMAFDNSRTGMPLMRPLFFADNNPALMSVKDAYLWGDAFLVAPVTAAGISQQTLPAPKGIWFDLWSDQPYTGGDKITVPVTADTIPVLVRAGAFIPQRRAITNAAHYSSKALELHYYHHPSITSASGKMYEDDGSTPNAHAKGLYELLNFASRYQPAQGLTIDLSSERPAKAYKGRPQKRSITLVIHNAEAPGAITLNGTRLRPKQVDYQAEQRLLTLRFNWNHQALAIQVEMDKARFLSQNLGPRVAKGEDESLSELH